VNVLDISSVRKKGLCKNSLLRSLLGQWKAKQIQRHRPRATPQRMHKGKNKSLNYDSSFVLGCDNPSDMLR
jgi:hypothetical protein